MPVSGPVSNDASLRLVDGPFSGALTLNVTLGGAARRGRSSPTHPNVMSLGEKAHRQRTVPLRLRKGRFRQALVRLFWLSVLCE